MTTRGAYDMCFSVPDTRDAAPRISPSSVPYHFGVATHEASPGLFSLSVVRTTSSFETSEAAPRHFQPFGSSYHFKHRNQ